MTDGAHRIQAPAVMLYGPSGIGKTVAALRALTPERTIWISTERGALKPAGNPALNPWHPRRPREELCLYSSMSKGDRKVFTEVEAAMQHAAAEVASGRIWNIVIDTLSSYTRRLDYFMRTVIEVDRAYGRAAEAVGSHLQPYLDKIHELTMGVQRPSGIWGATLVALCHERDPFQAPADKRTGEAAKPVPGGPDLPGSLAKKIRHDFDLVLRCDVRFALGRAQRCFSHDSLDKGYPTKDRWGIVPDRASGGSGLMPMDLGAVLRVGTAMDQGRRATDADLAILRSFEDGAPSRESL